MLITTLSLACATARAGAATIGPVTNPANGHDYYVTQDQLTWDACEAWAVSLGGHLAAINGSAENAWIVANLPLGADSYWLGARDDANTTDATFDWLTGEPWLYTNWTPGEPDDNAGLGGLGDYVLFDGSTGMWSDMNGTLPFFGGIAEVVPTTGVGTVPSAGAALRLVVQSLARDGRVSVRFELPRAASVELAAFDVNGRKLRTLASGAFAAGPHELSWDGRDAQANRVASGLYFVSLASEGQRRTARVVVAR